MSSLRFLTINIGSLLEPDWDRRRHEIVAWIDDLAPDVIAVQEAWESGPSDDSQARDSTVTDNTVTDNTAGWLAEHAAGDWFWRFGGDSFDSSLWPDPTLRFGSAVLSRWPIDASHYHRLPLAEVEPDDDFLAGVPWELLHVRTAGLDVFSTHLAPAPHHGLHRLAQVEAIDRIIDAAVRASGSDEPTDRGRRAAMPPILAGDFNAEHDSDEIRFLSGLTPVGGRTTFFQDAWRVAGDGGPGHTNDWRTNPIAAALNVHRKRIDYVFVGDPFRRVDHAGRVTHARVVMDEPRTGIVASDHAGVLAEIVWPDRPTSDSLTT